MDKAAAIASIRKKLTDGDIEAALQLLIENLEPKRQQLRDLNNRAIQAKAQLEKTQKDESQGIISFENSKLSYNQITRQVINLVDEWEHPSDTSSGKNTAPPRRFTPQMIMVSASLLILMSVIIWQIRPKNNQDGVTSATEHCPPADPESFNIMVLPYYPIKDPESKDSPHRSLARRLDRFKGEFSGKFRTSILRKDEPIPDTEEDAILSARECLAKLVIWGDYEHLTPVQNGTIITTNYKYLFPTETFEFTKLNLDDNEGVTQQLSTSSIPTSGIFVDTVQTYSAIINDGELTGELENQFKLLFGVAVMQGGNPQDAVAILEATQSSDSSSVLLKDMALAESHIMAGDKASAVKAYDRVLETHPNYWFATNNRALLYYEKGDYAESLETLDRKLAEDPDNIEALTVRGAVRIKTQQLKEAETDLRRAERLNDQQPEASNPDQRQYIRKKIDLLEREKSTEKERIKRANQVIASDRTNISALSDLAEANRNLGDYEQADKFATQVLKLDRNNLKAMTVKLETAARTNNQVEMTVIQKDVRQLDTNTQKTILQQRPILKSILDRAASKQQ